MTTHARTRPALTETPKGAEKPPALDAATAVLARRHAPILRLDATEPFAPDAVGITRLLPGQASLSSTKVPPVVAGASFVLEYAVWWDGNIQHLNALEHIWISFDAQDRPIAVSASARANASANASAHGGPLDLAECDWREGRPILICAPGNHALAAGVEAIKAQAKDLKELCLTAEIKTGILVPDLFTEALAALTPYDQLLAREFLKSLRFEPSFDFCRDADLALCHFLSWPELCAEVPRFLRAQCERLRARYRGIKAVFLDSGDTLIAEETQIFAEGRREIVLSADPIPGTLELMQALKERGYLVALVADGRFESFERVHGALGFWDNFEARAISEITGVLKPDPRMFTEAMRKLGLRPEDAPGIVMVGNNLKRDIRGANRLGLTSVWIDWNGRYDRVIERAEDTPDHTIKAPLELLTLLEDLTPEQVWSR